MSGGAHVDMPVNDSPVNQERNPQAFVGAVPALVLEAAPSQGLQRSALGPGAPGWAFVLPLLPDIQMEVLFLEH